MCVCVCVRIKKLLWFFVSTNLDCERDEPDTKKKECFELLLSLTLLALLPSMR